MQKNERKSVNVSMPQEEYERLICLAKETDRTAPGYIRWLLHEHFANLDKKQE